MRARQLSYSAMTKVVTYWNYWAQELKNLKMWYYIKKILPTYSVFKWLKNTMHKWPVPSNTSGQFVLQHQHSAANNNSTSVLPPSNGGYPPGGESYSFHGGGGGSMRPPAPLPTMFSVSWNYILPLVKMQFKMFSAI